MYLIELVSQISKELTKVNTQKPNDPVKKWAEDMNRYFPKEDIWMANRHMKRCATSLFIKEILIQTMMRYHLTPVRMANINSGNNRCWRGCGERGCLLHCWWEGKLVQPLWKTVWRFLKKLKLELPYDPAIALLGIYPRDTGVLFWRDTCTPRFIAALLVLEEDGSVGGLWAHRVLLIT